MSENFLQKLQEKHPNAWVLTVCQRQSTVENCKHLLQILQNLCPSVQIIHEQTLNNAKNWQQTAQLAQGERASETTVLQWIVDSEQNLSELLPTLTSEFDPQADIYVRPLAQLARPHKLALFDMDSTLIEQEVIVELAKKAGIGEQVNEITESAMRGEIDFNESFTRRVALLKGLPSAVLDDICHNHISFSLGAKRLIKTLKANGYHVVLVSGGFTYFAKYVQQYLGIDEIYANELDIVDGKVTGEITSPIVDGKRKAEILQSVAQRLKIDLNQTVAVGDGANDLPMIGLADIGVAYRAKPIVQQQAKFAVNVAGLDGVLFVLGLTAVE